MHLVRRSAKSVSWVDEETLARIGKQDLTSHDVSSRTSKSSSSSGEPNSRILRGYCGTKWSGPFNIKPKAHTEEEEVLKDEWREPKIDPRGDCLGQRGAFLSCDFGLSRTGSSSTVQSGSLDSLHSSSSISSSSAWALGLILNGPESLDPLAPQYFFFLFKKTHQIQCSNIIVSLNRGLLGYHIGLWQI